MKRLLQLLKRLLYYAVIGTIGFVVGAISLYVFLLTRGPELRVWHTARLEGEFTVERADEVVTLDDYRRLEDALFQQLDDEVYAHTPSGPTHALERFSDGSLADPRGYDVNWNRTFERVPDTAIGGALLLHGMSDSPYSMRGIGETLRDHGYHVLALRMPGHGTAPSGLKTATWQDMAAATRLGVRHLRSRLGDLPIHLVGYSNGAALAIDYCLNVLDDGEGTLPASLVLLSPSIGISPVAALAPWQARLAALPDLEKLAWTDLVPEFDPFKYGSFAVNAGVQVYELTSTLAARIEARSADGPITDMPPVLAMLSAVDATVSADAVVDVLLEHLAPGKHRLVLFDVNRAAVATPILVSDPGPLTARLLADDRLPFALTLVTNENPSSHRVVAHHKPAMSGETWVEALDAEWPKGVLSLSHVALPFPPDDPLYGTAHPGREDRLYLGRISVQGERGLLRFPADWLLRLRHNPFFDVVERRALEWIAP